ncbi:S-4TM family putative pore-forming effector [Nocardioides sp. GCM10030258]|uniref:S-4TM family putative pore-forming effector n=1 Tax=unclassified Nocardioides TaxID=2615069 RepID=UPI003605AE1A
MTNPFLAHNHPPAGIPAVPLHERQLKKTEVDLQRAATTTHRYTNIVASIQEVGAGGVAAIGLTFAILDKAQNQVAIGGFLWFLFSALVLGHFAQKFAEQAARIQETFDCRLFYLPWNETLAPSACVSHPQVVELAKKVKVGSPADKRITDGWYDPTDGLEYPYDVLITQEQNLAWDLRLRKRFRYILATIAVAWTTTGFIVTLAGTSMAETLLVVFVPAAAAYDLGRERWRAQRHVESERTRLAELVADALAEAQPGPITPRKRSELQTLARQVQDGTYRTRAEYGRVPGILYRHYRTSDEDQLAQVAEVQRSRLAP